LIVFIAVFTDVGDILFAGFGIVHEGVAEAVEAAPAVFLVEVEAELGSFFEVLLVFHLGSDDAGHAVAEAGGGIVVFITGIEHRLALYYI